MHQWRCKKMMMGMKHGHAPFGGVFFAIAMITYMVVALKLTFHIAQSASRHWPWRQRWMILRTASWMTRRRN